MKNILTIVLVCMSFVLYGQKIDISGHVEGEDSEVLQSATAVLLSPKDSTLVSFGLTDNNGRFKLMGVKADNYLLQVTYLGFEQYSETLDLTGKTEDLDLGTIKLNLDKNQLTEVLIEGEHTPVLVKKDTLEYNANAFTTQPNEVVEDLLRKMPGVEVEADGTVIAQGEEVQRVLVDGKEFFSNDPKMATKNLPAKSVNKVQFYDKKSEKAEFSGVDDGVRDKTMNLELKEEYKKGVFGAVELGGGTDQENEFRYENRLSFNQFTPKTQLSVIGNLNNVNKQGFSSSQFMSMMSAMGGFGGGRNSGFSFGGGLSNGFVDTGAGGINFNYDISNSLELNVSYFINNISNLVEQNRIRENFQAGQESFFNIDTTSSLSKNTNHSVQGRLEYEIDSTQQLQLNFGFNANDPFSELNEHRLTQNSLGLSNNLINNFNSDNLDQVMNWNTNLQYQKRFGKRFLSLEGEYYQGQNNLLGNQTSQDLIDPIAGFMHGYGSFDNEASYSLEASYVEPLGGGHYLEFGYERANNINDYGLTTDDLSFITPQQIDSLSNTNNRDYVYNLYGLSLQKNSETSNLTIGVDFQQSTLNGDFSIPGDGGPDELIQRIETPNTAFLPNFQWRYDLGKAQNVRFDYRTSIREPSLEQLQLRQDISDPLNVYIGNPDLGFEYQHRLRAHYHQYNQFNFSSIFAYISATYIQNKITNQTVIGNDFVKTTSPLNVDDDLNISGRISYSTPIRKLHIKTRVSTSMNYRNNIVFINGLESDANRYSGGLNLSFENRKKDNFDAEIGGRWNFNQVFYTLDDQLNQSYINQSYFTNLVLSALKGWNFKTGLDVNFYSEESFGEAAVIPIWTASISRYLLKEQRGEIRLSVFDLLNQNVGISRTSNLNYIESSEINSLGRYVMLSAIYNLKGNGGKEDNVKIRMHH
jgi:hypothetical protein